MTMITPSYLGETIEYSSLHACRSTLEDPTSESCLAGADGIPSGSGQTIFRRVNSVSGFLATIEAYVQLHGRNPSGRVKAVGVVTYTYGVQNLL